jgi:hypothetical protein
MDKIPKNDAKEFLWCEPVRIKKNELRVYFSAKFLKIDPLVFLAQTQTFDNNDTILIGSSTTACTIYNVGRQSQPGKTATNRQHISIQPVGVAKLI